MRKKAEKVEKEKSGKKRKKWQKAEKCGSGNSGKKLKKWLQK